MPDSQPSDLRIGDTERESALSALGEHMSAGRLDIDEYGGRSAQVAASKTRGELLAVFGDLPAPHPTFGAPAAPVAHAPGPPPVHRGSMVGQRAITALIPVAGLVAVGLYLLVFHFWVVFLIPAAVVMIRGALYGDERRHQRALEREEFRARRRELRYGRRHW